MVALKAWLIGHLQARSAFLYCKAFTVLLLRRLPLFIYYFKIVMDRSENRSIISAFVYEQAFHMS
jgi:hypothetical protein